MISQKRFTAGFIIVFGLLILTVSCKLMQGGQSTSYVGKPFTTESGLTYTIHKAGKGDRAEIGDMVSVHYAGRLTDSTEFDNSFKRGNPIQFTLGKGQVIKGWDEGIAILNVGDSATFRIPAHLAYGEQGRPGIPPNSELIFDVVLMDVMKPIDVTKMDSTVLEGGLVLYKVKSNPQGKETVKGKNVTVHYAGYLRDGKKFDSSYDRGKPFTFPLGQGRVIRGWDVGIDSLRVGERARLIIPPAMGYGEKGMGPIPGNSTLVFDVEVMDAD